LATVLQEIFAVQSDNSSLISLGNIGEDTVNHTDEHSVFKGLSGITNDGDDVSSLLGHSDQISSGSVGEFDSVDDTFLFYVRTLGVKVKYTGPTISATWETVVPEAAPK